LKKSQALAEWHGLTQGQNPLEHMTPIPYKSEGSRYGPRTLRIGGSPEFIDAVLSNLKPLLDGENQVTRLELARNEVKPTVINGEEKRFTNAASNAEVCYIRLHVRGQEGMMLAGYDKSLNAPTDRYLGN
jgi:hypothetical protein